MARKNKKPNPFSKGMALLGLVAKCVLLFSQVVVGAFFLFTNSPLWLIWLFGWFMFTLYSFLVS